MLLRRGLHRERQTLVGIDEGLVVSTLRKGQVEISALPLQGSRLVPIAKEVGVVGRWVGVH